jgi:hypothetical protein
MQTFAERLGVSTPTAYKYLDRLQLPRLHSKPNGDRSMKIFGAYKGKATCVTLAKKFGVNTTTIRYHIKRSIRLIWAHPLAKHLTAGLAKPTTLAEVKVFHEFVANRRYTPAIPSRIDVPMYKVEAYEQRCSKT